MSKNMSNISNPWQANARRQKAERLAVNLNAAGVLASDVPNIAPHFWLPLAKSAGVNPPSAEPIALIAELLREMEEAQARVSAMLASGADPFARFA